MARFQRTVPPPLLAEGKDYTAFRPDVRKDFECCCAYCLRHEDWGGTAEHYELDHFRPQKPFTEHINDFYNIYYCCHRCNQRKSNTWPTDQQQSSGYYFVDLCQDDFHQHYQLQADGRLKTLTDAAKYTEKRLRLNSDELVRQRANILKDGYALDKPRWQPE